MSPCATSALLQVPWVQALLPPDQRVGVITISKSSLTTWFHAGLRPRRFYGEADP